MGVFVFPFNHGCLCLSFSFFLCLSFFNEVAAGTGELYYWRERNREVDFVLRAGREVVVIEVKSGRSRDTHPGLAAFAALQLSRSVLVGSDRIPLEDLLLQPAAHWVAS
jgi:hypothetical protein